MRARIPANRLRILIVSPCGVAAHRLVPIVDVNTLRNPHGDPIPREPGRRVPRKRETRSGPRRRRNLHSGCAGVLGASRPVVESAACPLRRENCLMERAPYAPLNGRCSSGAWQAPVKDLIRIGFAFRRLQVPHRRVSIAEFFIASRAAPVARSYVRHRTDPTRSVGYANFGSWWVPSTCCRGRPGAERSSMPA